MPSRKTLGTALFLLLCNRWLAAQAPAAHIRIDTNRVIGEVHPHLFGNFAEHLGRCIYGGIFEEGSPLSDADGYRKDVLEAVKPLGVSHPSLARRELRLRLQLDGWHRPAGPAPGPSRSRLGRARDQPLRHRRVPALLRAHRRRAVYLHQRAAWARSTRHGSGWSTATKRGPPTGPNSGPRTAGRSRGTSRYWGLGNEIDGPWQLGHKNAGGLRQVRAGRGGGHAAGG